jgi:hypothetical protein
MSWMIGSAAEEGDTNIITRIVFKASLRTPKLGVVSSTFWEPVWEIAWDPFGLCGSSLETHARNFYGR